MAIESSLSLLDKVVKYAEERDQYNNYEKMKKTFMVDDGDSHPVDLTFRYTECRQPCPSFFQVERSPDDLWFVEELNETEAKWSKKHRYHMENLIKDEAARTISIHFNHLPDLKNIREEAIATNNYDFYHKGIRAAAILIHDLYPNEHFIRSGRHPLLYDQLNLLWEQYSVFGKMGWSFDELFKYIIRNKIDRREFSFVNETNIVPVLQDYETAISYKHMYDRPYSFRPSRPKNNATCVEIKKVTHKMKFRPRWKHDEYATFLLDLIKSDNWAGEEKILADVRKECDLKPLPKLFEEDPSDEEPSLEEKDLQSFLRSLILELRVMIWPKLSDVLWLISLLVRSASIYVSSAVTELIQVAELHRMALGSRFLRKNHFLWAFYKSGYGLPPRIRDTVNLKIVSEDHPPYHIYTAAVGLAKSLNEKKVRLEHFVFAVLYAKDSHVTVEEVMEMREDFKDFMEEVTWDFVKRFNRTSELWMEPYIAHFREEMLEEEFWSSKLGTFVNETSSTIS